MMSYNQLHDLAIKLHAPDCVVFPDYVQLLFLDNFYQVNDSGKIIFKGGTAVHLIYHAPQFSEDFDFTIITGEAEFESIINNVFDNIPRLYEIIFKERKPITGKRYQLTAAPSIINNHTYINLDFSFRESVKLIEKSPIKNDLPVIMTSTISYMGSDEIIIEKIRALLTRRKGRDVYDLAFLLVNHGKINKSLFNPKFNYYQDKNLSLSDVADRLSSFPTSSFVEALQPQIATIYKTNLKL